MKMQTIKPDDLIRKSLTALILDVGNQYLMRTKDVKIDTTYLLRRYESEGLAFLTKTLPKLGKHIDMSLKTGYFSPIESFKKDRSGNLPLFLRRLFQNVFDLGGTLLESPCPDSIRMLRQVCFMHYKLEGDYPQELVNECIESFVKTDSELVECEQIDTNKAALIFDASNFIKAVFADFDPEDIFPRPGPGQTADRTHQFARYEPKVRYEKLFQAYPYYRYFYNSSAHLIDRVHHYRKLSSRKSGISRLATVPKDSRGPRIICMEPHEYMWFQQGLGRKIVNHLEDHPLTRGHVNFTNQKINGDLALQGSIDGQWATLDMKEASDRISTSLVEALFDDCPKLLGKLLGASTEHIELPDGRIIRKKKFAPMGSALCFPVMSIAHYALMIAAIRVNHGVSLYEARKSCYVYGDDLIVKTKYVDSIMTEFPTYGLKFNPDKCCVQGHFRESCGVDAYAGVNITPQRVKTYTFPRKDGTKLSTALAVFHGLYTRGLWNTAKVWREGIERAYGNLPCVSDGSSCLGWVVPKAHLAEANRHWLRWHANLQSPALRARCIVTEPWCSLIGGWEQLLRSQVHCKQGNSTTIVERFRTKMVWKRIPLSGL